VLGYRATARMATVGHLADGLYVGFDYALGLLRVLVLLALWRAVLPTGEAGGMTWPRAPAWTTPSGMAPS
jgi:hypothetical protein